MTADSRDGLEDEDLPGEDAADVSGDEAVDDSDDSGEDSADGDSSGKKGKKKKSGKKLSTKKKVALGVVVVLALLVFVGLQPLKGTIRFGICKTFIELHIPYPPTLQINAVEEYELAARVYFSYIDPFGSSRLNVIECSFRPDPRTTYALQSVRLNRADMPQSVIDGFNPSIPYIIQHPPDLRLPVFKGKDLVNLKIDYN